MGPFYQVLFFRVLFINSRNWEASSSDQTLMFDQELQQWCQGLAKTSLEHSAQLIVFVLSIRYRLTIRTPTWPSSMIGHLHAAAFYFS
jgi:hypothetical protein